jgi:hypothetical protein
VIQCGPHPLYGWPAGELASMAGGRAVGILTKESVEKNGDTIHGSLVAGIESHLHRITQPLPRRSTRTLQSK